MEELTETIFEAFSNRGMTRRQFLKFCGISAAALGLPANAADVIAKALETAVKPPIIWLEFQDCTGDTESFLRAARRADAAINGKTDPSLTELLMDVLSVDYHETLMVAAGAQSEKSRTDTMAGYPGQYICIVEGSIPTALNGYCCAIGGRTAMSIAKEVCANAQLTIALGTCAWEGGLASAYPNPTGAKGVKDVVPDLANLINIPGCPANVVNLQATIVYFLTYQQKPPLDSLGRPVFAYGRTVHSLCERREREEAESFGDTNYRSGGCLSELGCRGPQTYANCPTVKWNDGYCWPIAAGHPCIGCTNPDFWDQMLPIYRS